MYVLHYILTKSKAFLIAFNNHSQTTDGISKKKANKNFTNRQSFSVNNISIQQWLQCGIFYGINLINVSTFCVCVFQFKQPA